MSRHPGLGSDLLSFNFKLLHQLLVTKKRTHQFNPRNPATCCHCDENVEEDLQHSLLNCSYNDGAGQVLLSAVQAHLPHTSAAALLRLELTTMPEDLELPMVTIISCILSSIWEKRLSKSRIILYEIRATLEARCLLLRETRYKNELPKFAEIMNNL